MTTATDDQRDGLGLAPMETPPNSKPFREEIARLRAALAEERERRERAEALAEARLGHYADEVAARLTYQYALTDEREAHAKTNAALAEERERLAAMTAAWQRANDAADGYLTAMEREQEAKLAAESQLAALRAAPAKAKGEGK